MSNEEKQQREIVWNNEFQEYLDNLDHIKKLKMQISSIEKCNKMARVFLSKEGLKLGISFTERINDFLADIQNRARS